MNYDLKHLTQNSDQCVLGPIQDDEALALYAIIKVMRIKKVVEIGAQTGYSASNFLAAVEGDGVVLSVDINPIRKISENHITVVKDVAAIQPEEIPFEIELLFYDCHNINAQLHFHDKMLQANKITKKTTIVLHDTNLHPTKITNNSYQLADGWCHQPDERRMVNLLVDQGWHALCLHTKADSHGKDMPFRHGLTIMQRFTPLEV
jgi:hypothetical protein